ncbi:MAG: hypothetical protein ACR2N4_12060, partial [Jatrophihabitans sp.]
HIEQVLRADRPGGLGEPRFAGERVSQLIRYRSPAVALALPQLAAAHGVPSSAALLAMFAVGLGRHTGHNPLVVTLMVSNRFRPGFADSVSALVQPSPYLIDIEGISLDQAVGTVAGGLLHTYKNAYYDPYQHEELVARIGRERGEQLDLWCLYDDRRKHQDRAFAPGSPGSPASTAQLGPELSRALTRSSWQREHEPAMHCRKLFLHVDDPPGSIDFLLSVDSRYFAVEDMLAILRAIEDATVQAVLHPDAPTRIGARIAQPG